MHSRSAEDYLEAIYELICEKGYARASEIAQRLNVRTPSVTEMVQKLDEDGLLIYEKYKGITLTSDGQKIAKSVSKRHNLLFDLLTTLGVDEEIANRDACGIEHCLNPESVEAITRLLTQLKSPAGKKLLEELDQV